MSNETQTAAVPELIKIDLGCGPNKRAGFLGVDRIAFPGVDVVLDLHTAWPWADGSVEEIHTSHCMEHFTAEGRRHIYNEMFRVLRKGGKATIIVPNWTSGRAYGDLTHQWPPYCDFHFFYLLESWRLANAPHDDARWSPTGYKCDFDATWGYAVSPEFQPRNQEFQQFALRHYTEAALDIIATIIKR